MVNIIVSNSGVVTGDSGKIIGYEGQGYSDIFTITHPQFSGAEDFIEYKYGNTIYRNKLDSNGQVSIQIGKAGYVKCQYLAIDIATGEIRFKSDPWVCIIKESLKIQPSHFPCDNIGHQYNHRRPQIVAGYYYDDPFGFIYGKHELFNAYEAYNKLNDKIENESSIRIEELSLIRNDISLIKEALNINETVASKINPNTLIEDGTYKVEYNNEYLENLPNQNSTNGYTITVINFGENSILQTAKEDDTSALYQRTMLDKLSDNWSQWTLITIE